MPILEDSWVQAKLARFHANMASTLFSHCSSCNESFPSINVDPLLHVIAVQARDKREPKLYSAANNNVEALLCIPGCYHLELIARIP